MQEPLPLLFGCLAFLIVTSVVTADGEFTHYSVLICLHSKTKLRIKKKKCYHVKCSN